MKVTTTETITLAIKAHSDKVAAAGAFSIANPTVPLRDNPHVDDVADRRLLQAAFGTAQVEYMCPCGYMTPKITDDLRVRHDAGSMMPNCNSSTVVVRRTVRKGK